MSKPYILAHDTGTGGDKAVLTDLRGRIVDSAYQAYGLNYPRPDWAEQDLGQGCSVLCVCVMLSGAKHLYLV
jgi:sugar (pentulose or hexulose) kinase